MADWIIGYQKAVQGAGPGVTPEEWQRFEVEAPEPPPAELKALYSAFNGGALGGEVTLYPFDKVVAARNSGDESRWMFGERGSSRLMAARKATLASMPGLQQRPSWFETTGADERVFASHDSKTGAVRVYPSLEQLLAMKVPPAQTEEFGDLTYARAMAAVENVISEVSQKVKAAAGEVVAKATASMGRGAAAAKSAGARKPAARRAGARKPAAKKAAPRRGAKRPAAKKALKGAAAKKPAASKAAAKRGAKRSAARKPAASKAAPKRGVKRPAARKPAAKKAAPKRGRRK